MSSIVSLSDLSLPALGTSSIALLDAPASGPEGGFAVIPGDLSGMIGTYTLIFDLHAGSDSGWSYNSLFQTDLSNGSDGEFFMLRSGDSFGIGISGQYAGAFGLDAWHRLVVTAEIAEDGSNLMSGYVDGTYVGTVVQADGRFLIDADGGFLILADNDGETAAQQLGAFAFLPLALDGAAVAALGGVDAAGTGAANAAEAPGCPQDAVARQGGRAIRLPEAAVLRIGMTLVPPRARIAEWHRRVSEAPPAVPGIAHRGASVRARWATAHPQAARR